MDRNTTNEIVIPLSKRKLVLLLLGAAASVVVSLWLWSIAETQTRFHPLRVRAAAVVGAFFFGICAVYGCIKFFDSKPGLIVDREGIVDNSSGVSVGRVPWDEITGLKVTALSGQRFLTIEVVDPRKYIGRGNFFQRQLIASNVKMTGSPINISSNSLSLKFDDLHRILVESFERYRGNSFD